MKDQYTGDIGDYGKYGLLRFLSENGAGIFVNWYLSEDDGSADGKHVTYLENEGKFRKFDPALFDILEKIVRTGNRSITAFEKEDCIKGASYYHEVLTPNRDRKEWHRAGLSAAAGKDIVFLDPDNGLTGKKKSAKDSVKFCFADEVSDYYNASADVVYYCQRDRSPADLWHERLKAMQSFLPAATIMAVTCHRGTQRTYVFVLHEEDAERYSRLIDEFVNKWAGFFTREDISLDKEKEDLIKPGRYRHYKALYGEGQVWVRPASMWNEPVIKDGKELKRFTYIEEK